MSTAFVVAGDSASRDDSIPATAELITVVDPHGIERLLRLLDDGTMYEGMHDTGLGPEPYWLPASTVRTWERVGG